MIYIPGNEDKFKIITITRVPDVMDLRVVQGRKPNDIKKVSKTDEKRKKKFEVKEVAARLLK
ncbi:hypothetical protein CTI12_AA337670 [Artemisia annua]|uniref:Uncharacterized protein n=1 Tax=Artemisia annua TaxID=35608 RepID=A0A2U1MW31_ARTAN|nr:hypothetical protein CTI12_AA337670 [Artemisia annua]